MRFQDFVTTYNDVMDFIEKVATQIMMKNLEFLAGDSLLRTIMNEMRESNSTEIKWI